MKFSIKVTDKDSQATIAAVVALLTLAGESSRVSLYLDNDGDRKIACIKAYREVATSVLNRTQPDLRDSLDIIRAGGALFTGITRAEAAKATAIFAAIEGVKVHYA